MIRLTKQTDYGIIMLTHLASAPEATFTARDIAEHVQLPLPIVGKILKLLTREGLLSSHRGVKGGYSLARSADDISVAQIIGALEGPIAITECIASDPGTCGQEPICPVRVNWHRINRAIREVLEQLRLSDMVVQLPDCGQWFHARAISSEKPTPCSAGMIPAAGGCCHQPAADNLISIQPGL